MNQSTGWVMLCTQVSVPRGRDDIRFIWQGGDTARLTRGNSSLLDFDPYGVISNHYPEVGEVLTYGDYPVRCVAVDEDGITLERLRSPS